jgi:Fe-S cluster assembly ATPase SufC
MERPDFLQVVAVNPSLVLLDSPDSEPNANDLSLREDVEPVNTTRTRGMTAARRTVQ